MYNFYCCNICIILYYIFNLYVRLYILVLRLNYIVVYVITMLGCIFLFYYRARLYLAVLLLRLSTCLGCAFVRAQNFNLYGLYLYPNLLSFQVWTFMVLLRLYRACKICRLCYYCKVYGLFKPGCNLLYSRLT